MNRAKIRKTILAFLWRSKDEISVGSLMSHVGRKIKRVNSSHLKLIENEIFSLEHRRMVDIYEKNATRMVVLPCFRKQPLLFDLR